MNQLLICYTLFDITNTGVLNRARPTEEQDYEEWSIKRNQQSNFDTVLQVISLRSQPEVITTPVKIFLGSKNEELFQKFFGFLYLPMLDNTEIPCWTFTFEVQHSSVFEDGINELGALYNDCDGVPMIKCGTEWTKLSMSLDTTPECRNIYFAKESK